MRIRCLFGLLGWLLIGSCQQPFYLEEDLPFDYQVMQDHRFLLRVPVKSALLLDGAQAMAKSTPVPQGPGIWSFSRMPLLDPSRRFAYSFAAASDRSEERFDIYRMDLHDPDLKQVKVGQINQSYFWGGEELAYWAVKEANPLKLLRITYSDSLGILGLSEWSPGQAEFQPLQSYQIQGLGLINQIKLSRDRQHLALELAKEYQVRPTILMVLDMKENWLRIVKQFNGPRQVYFTDFALSPGGEWLSYTALAYNSHANPKPELGLISIETAIVERIVPVPASAAVGSWSSYDIYADWSPDGTQLVVASERVLSIFSLSDDSFMPLNPPQEERRFLGVYWLE